MNSVPNFSLNQNGYYCPCCNSNLISSRESPDKVKILRCQSASCMNFSLTLKGNKPILIKYHTKYNFYLLWHSENILTVGTDKSPFNGKTIISAICKEEIGSDSWHQILNEVNASTINRIEKLKIFK